MKRRRFIGTVGTGALALSLHPLVRGRSNTGPRNTGKYIRFGSKEFKKSDDPKEWIEDVKRLGYRTAEVPLRADPPLVDSTLIRAFREAALKNDIVLAEVGAWSNPISSDPEVAKAGLDKCINGLQLAEEIGARCCVNTAGSRGPIAKARAHKDNLTAETFDMIVDTARRIIDAVRPKRAFFTLEMMQWIYPDSIDSYLKLIQAIDRKQFGVHIDPVNLVNSPWRYYNNGQLIKEMFNKLGPYIKSCHAKDILLDESEPIVHLSEVIAGKGNINYPVFLTELARLDDVPLLMEHLKTPEQYAEAAAYIRGIGKGLGISM